MVINRNKTVMANLIDLIKESNPEMPDMTHTQVTYGAPVEDDSVVGCNSRIVITALSNAGFSGTRTLWYSRCTLVQGLGEPNPVVERGVGETDFELSARVMELLNIHPTQVNVTWPDSTTITFSGNRTRDYTCPVTIQWCSPTRNLSTVVGR